METEQKNLEIGKDTQEKIRVLWLSDTPTCSTGFATVVKNLLRILNATGKYEFTIIGINQTDWYDREKYPYQIFEATPALSMDPRHRDLFGRQRLLQFLGTGRFDLVFTLQDTFIIEEIAPLIIETRKQMVENNKRAGRLVFKPFRWIYYYPIDAKPKGNWLMKSAFLADFPVCYTQYGKQESIDVMKEEVAAPNRLELVQKLNELVRVIYHGVNTTDFNYVIDREKVKEFRTKMFEGLTDGKFLVVNVNRNQPRKDIARTMKTFAKFLETNPDSFLYLHCQVSDAGGNLQEIARNYPILQFGKNWSCPKDFDAHFGVSIEELNMIYNCADVIISTTTGEGWGLSFTEAMATKTPVIAPRNTSALEIIGMNEERGLLASCGTTFSEWVVMMNDNGCERPLVNIESMLKKLEFVKENLGKESLQKKIDAAYEWVQKLTWDSDGIGGQWLKIFDAAYNELLKEKWIMGQKVERNELCPCGSGRKYKKCHGA